MAYGWTDCINKLLEWVKAEQLKGE